MGKKKVKGIARLRYIFFLMKPYWKYGRMFVLLKIFLSAVLTPLSAYLSAMLPQRAIDSVMQDAVRKDIIVTIGLYTLGIALIAGVQKFFTFSYTQMILVKIGNKIRNDVNEKALHTDFKYYDQPEFFTKFLFAQEEYPMHAQNVVMLFPEILSGFITMLAMGAIIISVGPVLLGVTVFFVVLSGIAALPTLKPNADFQMNVTEAWRPLDYVSRMLKQKENAAELRSSGAGKKFLLSINGAMRQFQTVYTQYIKKVAPFLLFQGVIEPVQAACVLAYVIVFVIAGDKTQIGLYASLTVASTVLTSSLSGFSGAVTEILQRTLYGERVASFFEAESEIEPPRKNAVASPEGEFELEFRDVSFAYENTSFGLEHFNLHIRPGQRIAIVGENGAGKTTLTKLLLRLYDVNSGAILINGHNIKEYDIHALRLRIGVAFQDVRVLAMSLRDNLTAYNEATDERLYAVIDKLGLREILEKANGDLHTMVSREFTEKGIALSGGEAQRMALARLFIGTFGLLVLDEPTSALDPLAEHRLMQTISDISNTATTVMIAHRLSTVRDFDRIYHMENAQIIESGTHEELMKAKGKYHEMFTRQAENYQMRDE